MEYNKKIRVFSNELSKLRVACADRCRGDFMSHVRDVEHEQHFSEEDGRD